MAKKHHKYYSEDTEQRKKYFDGQFLSNAKSYSKSQGITLGLLLSQIKNFEDFKEFLEIIWSEDSSLLSYFEGMDDEELEEFYKRDVIQNIVSEEKEINEDKVPDLVYQENKKTQKVFLGEIKNKKTGKKSKVFVKQVSFIKQGKRVTAYKDSKGHFAKRI